VTNTDPAESNLTPEQRLSVEAAGANVAVRAGAGSGKTKVLTERFLRHLGEPERIPLARIVALTFTEKAARQLRDRVRAACRQKLKQKDDASYWRLVLRGLDAAPIGTFHAFCGQILRRFATEAGVEPGFAILEESIAPTLRDQVLADCIRGWLRARHADFITLASELGLNRIRDALADLIESRSRGDLRHWATQDPEKTMWEWERVWATEARPALLAEFISDGEACLKALIEQCGRNPKMTQRRAFLLANLPALATHENPTELLSELRDNARVQGAGTAKDWPTQDTYDRVRKELEKLRGLIDKVTERLVWDRDATLSAAQQGQRFARLAVEAVDAYERAKRDEEMLDFDDLQLKVRDLLRDGPPGVRQEIAGEIAFFLVDEFQDTDPIQDEIIRLLLDERAEKGPLFLVGDAKQSIYRFRGADPGLFEARRAALPESGQRQLSVNFRSTPAVLNFVNSLFADAFPGGTENVLRAGRESLAPEENPAIEFVWAHDPDHEDAARVSVDVRRETEATWLAPHIATSLRNKRWKVRDENTKLSRPAQAGDVVLLFRTLNDAAVYESALAAEGLDYYIVGGSAFYGQQEVLDVINLLSVIEDPCDALALAATIRSPFGSVSDEGLYWLTTSAGGLLTEGFERWDRVAELSASDRHRAGHLHELVSRWRLLKDRAPIATVLDRALDESGYEAALMGEFLGPRKRANVRKLVRLARRFDLQGGLTLADFVARLRADLRKPPREEQAATTDEKSPTIRLMTIHQAKGLEFPVVIVPDLNRDVPRTSKTAVLHPELGAITAPSDDYEPGSDSESESAGQSLGLLTYRQLEAVAEREEAIRLFYVATTRAEDVLILSAGMKCDEEPVSPAMKLLASRFDRESGEFDAAESPGLSAPPVRVVEKPPESTVQSPRSTSHPRRALAIRAVTETTVSDQAPAVTTFNRPGSIDLNPAVVLTPSAARFDRLIRTILADPQALKADRLLACVERAARVQQPSATAHMVEQARSRLEPWVSSALGRQLAKANERRQAVPWTVRWPRDDVNGIVFQGGIDFAFRESTGDWTLVALADTEVSEPMERLRVLLSAEVAESMLSERPKRAWHVRLGAQIQQELVSPLDSSLIPSAIEDVLNELNARREAWRGR
jgi:ATP-dependent helicase/nuclease subunit A